MYTDSYAVKAGTRADQAYAELKRRLLVGDFPLNVRLGEERLAALVGVSRTPVREALFRLHAEDLVSRWSDGGFRPVAPDVDMIGDIYEVRSTLETAALHRPEKSQGVHDRDALEALRAEWVGLAESANHEPDPSFVSHDESFHISLAEAAGNYVLVDQLEVLNDRIRIVRMQDFLVEGRIEATISEHLGILDAVLSGEIDLAETLLADHIGLSESVVADRVRRAVTRMASGGDA